MGCKFSANVHGESLSDNNKVSLGQAQHLNPSMFLKPIEVSDPNDVKRTKTFNQYLEKERQQNNAKVKLLLLGAGESGKSTIFKQMRILHGSPLDDDELRVYGVIVRSNIVIAMRKLCLHLHNLGLEEQLAKEGPIAEAYPNYDNLAGDVCVALSSSPCNGKVTPQEAFNEIMHHLIVDTPVDDHNSGANTSGIQSINPDDWVGHCPRAGAAANQDAKLFLQHSHAIWTLWKSQTMKLVWSKRASANVIDSHKDFLNQVGRIASAHYKPTLQDTLLARVKTSRVQTNQYRIEGIDFEVYDVGGQRSERRKWIDCFDEVDAVIFVAALCEYDQCLAETSRNWRSRMTGTTRGNHNSSTCCSGNTHTHSPPKKRNTNRMVETLNLFRSVINNRAFVNKPILLFLNKKDVFAEKVLCSPIEAQPEFADYKGAPHDFDDGVQYFMQKFRDCLEDEQRLSGGGDGGSTSTPPFCDNFIHVTNATDTNNMEFVLDASRSIVVTQNLYNSGFL